MIWCIIKPLKHAQAQLSCVQVERLHDEAARNGHLLNTISYLNFFPTVRQFIFQSNFLKKPVAQLADFHGRAARLCVIC